MNSQVQNTEPQRHDRLETNFFRVFYVSCCCDLVLLYFGYSFKAMCSALGTEIAILAYALYCAEMRPEQPRPVRTDPVTWFLFFVTTAIAGGVQLHEGNSALRALPLIITAVGCLVVFIAAWLVLKSEWRFQRIHWITSLLVVIAMIFFVKIHISAENAQNARLAAIFATGADLIAYIPSVINAYDHPNDESPRNLLLNGIKFFPAFLALPIQTFSASVFIVVIGSVNIIYYFVLRHWQKSAKT